MPLVVAISVLILLFLMTKLRLNGFAALLLVAVGVGLVRGIPLEKIPDVLSEGTGGQIGDTMLTIGLGAMVGRVMGDSGAAAHRAAADPARRDLGVRTADRPQPGGGQRVVPVGRPGDGDDPAGDRRARRLQTGPRRRRDLRLHQGRHAQLVALTDHPRLAHRGHPRGGPRLGHRRRRHRLGRRPPAARRQRGPPGDDGARRLLGSIAFSHVNDPGFWMFKEYFNLSVLDATKARTTYTTVFAVLGLGGVLAMEPILDAIGV